MWVSYEETAVEVSCKLFYFHKVFQFDLSATNREAFERNSRAVELSPEHVPDINVITGVLKDYLRELPEPLFTKCLFQMTVDALGKDCDENFLSFRQFLLFYRRLSPR